MTKSPAFQFYAKDFLSGTATMSLQEVGAYIRLLAHEWDAGSIPADPEERARLLVCAKAQERELWKKVGRKFLLSGDVYINERLEDERQKQAERRRRLSDNGKLGGRPTKANEKLEVKQTESNSFPAAKANENLNERLAFASSSSKEQKTTHTARVLGHGNGANPPGSLPRDHRFHAVCGGRMRVCLSEKTAANFAADWGGDQAEALNVLQRFCNELEAQIGDGPKGDHLWLLAEFDAFKARSGRVPVVSPKPEKPVKDDSAQLAKLHAIERGEKWR